MGGACAGKASARGLGGVDAGGKQRNRVRVWSRATRCRPLGSIDNRNRGDVRLPLQNGGIGWFYSSLGEGSMAVFSGVVKAQALKARRAGCSCTRAGHRCFEPAAATRWPVNHEAGQGDMAW